MRSARFDDRLINEPLGDLKVTSLDLVNHLLRQRCETQELCHALDLYTLSLRDLRDLRSAVSLCLPRDAALNVVIERRRGLWMAHRTRVGSLAVEPLRDEPARRVHEDAGYHLPLP